MVKSVVFVSRREAALYPYGIKNTLARISAEAMAQNKTIVEAVAYLKTDGKISMHYKFAAVTFSPNGEVHVYGDSLTARLVNECI